MRASVTLAVAALLLAGCNAPADDGGREDATPDAGPMSLTPFECAADAFRMGDVNVTIDTDKGAIAAVLHGARSPETVCNFLRYVQDDHYDATVWHRVCAGFVIQAGGLDVLGQSDPARAPIRNEGPASKLRNHRGTLAMARTAEPDSATTHFFVNLVDNLRLDFDGELAPGYRCSAT